MWEYNQIDELYNNVWEYKNPDELYHHGILGMHWRHRKAQMNQNKKLREYRKAEKKAEYNVRFNRAMKFGGRRNIKTGAAIKTLAGLGEIGYGVARQQLYNRHFKTNNRVINGMNTGINGLFVARGIQNIISGHKDRKALKEYDIKKMNEKYKKHKKR